MSSRKEETTTLDGSNFFSRGLCEAIGGIENDDDFILKHNDVIRTVRNMHHTRVCLSTLALSSQIHASIESLLLPANFLNSTAPLG